MDKKLHISVSAEGNSARIEIIGSISEWNANNAADFRARCAGIKSAGINSCHVYLMTMGGDCFQANEIVNILREVFGTYTAEGGAVIASAGTYIAVCASSFAIAANGQFMIHKPSAWIDGNETEMECALKLLKNITKNYYSTYVSKLKKPETAFKAKWEAGDFWMTAHEAMDWGFVTEVKSQPADIDAQTAGMIRACGSPIEISINSNNNHQFKMKNLVSLLIVALALDKITPESSETEVIAAVQGKFNDLNKKVADMEAQVKAQLSGTIKSMLDQAQAQGKITASGGKKIEEVRAVYEKIGETGGLEALSTVLAGLPGQKSITEQLKPESAGSTAAGNKDWNWYQSNAPEALVQMERENPDAFKALYRAEYGTHPQNM